MLYLKTYIVQTIEKTTQKVQNIKCPLKHFDKVKK